MCAVAVDYIMQCLVIASKYLLHASANLSMNLIISFVQRNQRGPRGFNAYLVGAVCLPTRRSRNKGGMRAGGRTGRTYWQAEDYGGTTEGGWRQWQEGERWDRVPVSVSEKTRWIVSPWARVSNWKSQPGDPLSHHEIGKPNGLPRRWFFWRVCKESLGAPAGEF